MILEHPRVLRSAGLTVAELPGWRTRAVINPRTGRPYPFDPAGLLVHDDIIGPAEPEAIARFLAEKGRPDLRAPLYGKWIDRAGVWWMLAAGNCNHAGRGDARALQRIRSDQPPGPADREDVVGNSHLDSVCLANHPDFDDGHPRQQLQSLVTGLAAIAAHEGWSANRVIRHGEFTDRKPDARLDGWWLRAAINAYMEDDMPWTDEDRADQKAIRAALESINHQIAGEGTRLARLVRAAEALKTKIVGG